jgi:hypothetical protein
MIITAHIHIGPALQNPFKVIINTGVTRIIQNRTITTLPKPDQSRMVGHE